MKNITWWQKSILTIVCVGLLVSPAAVQAQAVVTDPVNLGERITEFFQTLGQNLKKTMGAVAYKNMLSAFLSKMAYDAAVWVSSAGTGQETLVYTQPWDEYIADAADGALGEYVSSLADEAGFTAFNVCAPANETVRLNIALGLETSLINPDEPDCKISQLGENWASVIEADELGDYFVLSFDPAENEIGTFLTLKSTFGEWSAREGEAATLERETDGAVGSKKGTISQYIQTPGDWINDSFKSSVEDTKTPYKTYTGEVLADTLNIFTSTLFSKLVERMQGGFIPTDTGTSLSDLISGSTGGTTGGVAAAKATYATLNQPVFNPGGEIDSAYQLVEDGIIDQTFQLAIENQWRLQEFIDYLNDNVEGGADNYLFGVESDEISSASAGITRRGIYLLKKYRIVPVGWQIAADLIYYNRDNADLSGVSLGDLADCSDGDCLFNDCSIDSDYSEFCKLVDPDWVLKSPQAYCAKESYGLTTAYDDFLDQDGNEYNQDEHILTRQQECVDEMTCINEDDQGNCYDYGYCVKDKRTYQFEGEGCTEEVASCQGYERQSDETEVNYLTNTLNYGDCNNDDAVGCTWYCQNEGTIEDTWGCLNATQSYAECDDTTGAVEEYCFCSTEETCDVSIYDTTCTVSSGETCTLSEVCSPENEYYAGTYCTCSLVDSAYMEVGDADGIVATDVYGWDCSLDDTSTCETTSDSYFTYLNCDSQTCGAYADAVDVEDCIIYEGEYSCTNDDGDECYIAIDDNQPQDLATVYLNDQVESCSSSDAGCTEYIPARENNLLFNSSFEDYDDIDNDNDLGVCSNLELLDPLASPYCSSDIYCDTGTCEGWNGGSSVGTVETNDTTAITSTSYGSVFMHLDGTGGILSQTIDYSSYSLADRTFVISLQAYSASTCDLYVGLSGTDNDYRDALTASLTGDEIWTTYTSDPITFPSDETGTAITLAVANVCDVYIDAIQLEENSSASSYTDYGTADLVYLNEDAVECQSSEVGCSLYTPTSGKFREDVPGIITNEESDACTGPSGSADPDCSQCYSSYVGCDYYQEQSLSQTIPLAADTSRAILTAIGATTGTQSRLAVNDRTGSYCYRDQSVSCYDNSDCGSYGPCLDTVSIVPSTATSCSASAVGCESYTNLGTVAEGGEGTEYYNYLKQCVTTADLQQDTYYSWEGSDESGYQLKSHTLKKASDGAPCTNLDLASEDYNATCVDDPVYNPANDCSTTYGTDPDCILYYNDAGAPFYRYESEVIVVDDECIPLRNDNDGRTYYILSDESTTCSSEDVGCREYKGSEGEAVKLLIDDDFSDCSTGDWVALGSEALDAPSESVYVDDCSLSIVDSYYPLYFTDDDGTDYAYLEEGNSYIVTFWAKGSDSVSVGLDTNSDTVADVYFTNTGSSETASSATAISLDSADWQEYILGPVFVDNLTSDTPNLIVEYSGTGYFDSFYLQESESQYLIQGSADLCQGYEGCQTYEDEDGTEYYLKSFARLCSEDRVGCEIVYNSENTSGNPYAHRYNLSNEYDEDDLIIPSDQIEYLVLDGDNECSSLEKGCQALGEADVDEMDGSIDGWETNYLINDPDSYDSILCQYQHLGCLEYESPYDGMVYFKDPGSKTCYFDSTDNVWYKNGTEDLCDLFNPSDSPSQPMGSVCDSQSGDLEGEYCQYDDDCGAGRCIDTNSDSGWVGTCENEDSGCTEYSDPYTGEELVTNYSFEYDEINNSTGSLYDTDEALDNKPDYWYDLVDHDSFDFVTQADILSQFDLTSATDCATFEMNTSASHQYSNGLSVSGSLGSPCIVLSNNRIEVDPNKTYNLSAYIQESVAGSGRFIAPKYRIGLLYYNEDDHSLVVATDDQKYLAADRTTSVSSTLSTDWSYYHGTIGYGKSVEFPEGTTHAWPFVYNNNGGIYVDELSLKEEEDYYYLDYTIDGTEEGSVSGTTTDACVTGIDEGEGCLAFRDNTREDQTYLSNGESCTACTYGTGSDTCTATEDTCDTNVVISVRPDRVCDQWIDCYYYNEVTSDNGDESELECLGLGICQGINDEGDCTDWAELPLTPDGSDDLTYLSQADAQSVNALDEIKDYTGYSKVGMIWPSIKSCEGGYKDGRSCDTDSDCEDRGTCETGDRTGTCSGGSLSGTVCIPSNPDACHNEAQDGECSGVFKIQGYYPYAAMVEYGDLDEEVIEDGDFEDLFCEGHGRAASRVDTNSPCIIDSHCNNTEIDSYNESIEEGIYDSSSGSSTINEGCASYGFRGECDDVNYYTCPNNYGSSDEDEWAFSRWQAEGDSDLMVVQYSDDETYSGDSRYNSSDNLGDSFSNPGATYAQDWNNVLKVNVTSGQPDGVRYTGLEASVVLGNTYTLSFKGKYLTGMDEDDLLNVGLRHTDETGNEYMDWFAKGNGMVDLVFVIDTYGTVSNFRTALGAALDDIEDNMPDGVSYKAALVESDASGNSNLIQDLDTLDVFESSLSALSYSGLVGGTTCNIDAMYEAVNNSLDSGSGDISYRDEATKVIVLITDDSGYHAGCDVRGQDIIPSLIASPEASYYVLFSDTPHMDDGYEDIEYLMGYDGCASNTSSDSDYSSFIANMVTRETSAENMQQFQMTTSWDDYSFGPLTITEKPEEPGVSTDLVIYQSSDSSGVDFIIDDVSLLPTLDVNPDLDQIARDCRAYPESSSLSCSYYKGGGNYYRGWMGYCLEYDPEDDSNCLVWWPTDRIKGESFISSLRSEAGYDDRSPVYNCLVSKGYAQVGFCVDTVDPDNTYTAYGRVDIDAPTVDYSDQDGSNYTICGSDSNCPGDQICFKGADLSTSLQPLMDGSTPDARYVYFDDSLSSNVFQTIEQDAQDYYTQLPLYDLDTNNYVAYTRRFNGGIIGRYTCDGSSGHVESNCTDVPGDTENGAMVIRYLANPLERNIHISELQGIGFDPGKPGELYNPDDESKAFSPRALLSGQEINLLDQSNDWGYATGQTAPADIETYCQDEYEGNSEGIGCYTVRIVSDDDDNNGDDDSMNIVYTYAYSPWKDDGDDLATAMGMGLEALLDDDSAYNGDLNPQVRELIGKGSYSGDEGGTDSDACDDQIYGTDIAQYQNPWEHLQDLRLDNYDGSSANILSSGNNIAYGAGLSSEEGWFRAYDTSGGGDNYGGNVVSVMFDFDENGYLKQIFTLLWFGAYESGDPHGNNTAAASYEQPMILKYYLREPCAVIAKSVDTDESTYSWSSRISDTNYVLPGSLNMYNMFDSVDDYPFGAIPPYEDESSPDDSWDSIRTSDISDLNDYPINAPFAMDNSEEFNAGWPISCIGNCQTRVCSYDYSTTCSTDGNCPDGGPCIGVGGICKDDASGELTGEFCDNDGDCNSTESCQAYGYDEMGYTYSSSYAAQASEATSLALTRYKYLFAAPLNIYQAEVGSDGYSWDDVTSEVGFSSFNRGAMPQCPDNERDVDTSYDSISDSSSEYCGVVPELVDQMIEINGSSSGEIEADKTQKITLTFTSEVDPEQLPLEKIYIDWYGADWGQDWTEHDWGYGAAYHSYSWYSSCTTSSSNYCSGNTYSSGDACEHNGYCVYKPRVTVVDHWGWASGQDGGSDHRAFYTAGYTLDDDATYDEFDGLLLVTP